MDLKVVSNIISGQDSIRNLDTEELARLVDKYPYSQTFAILYLKSMAETNSFEFNEVLEKYAYRVTDRMRLYDIIQQKESFSTEENPLEVSDEESKNLTIAIEIEEVSEPILTTEIGEEIQESLEEAQEEESSSEETISEEIEKIEETSEKIEIAATPLEGKELITTPEETEEETFVGTEMSIGVEEENEALEEISVEIQETPIDETKEESQMDPLEKIILTSAANQAYIHQLEKEIEEATAAEVKEVVEVEETKKVQPKTISKPVEEQKRSFLSWIEAGDPNAIPMVDKEIVEELTKDNPTITERKEFYSPSKKAKESLSTDTILYSETLANIIELQGNYSLAIEAYEQLSLSNPKKRIIFAKKIESLKEKLTNLK